MPETDHSDISISSSIVEKEKKISDSPPPRNLSPGPSKPKEDEKHSTEEWLDVLGSGDLKVKTLREGQPNTRPQNFDLCSIKLEVTLENGEVVEQHDELVVEANGSEVVQGLDLILPLLDIGQQVTAIVKPRFAYGALGLKPKIPPNATLVYNVELLKVEYPPELTSVTFEARKKKAMLKKEKGNWWYSRGDATKAIQCYRAALDVLQDSTPYTGEGNISTEMPESVFREMVQQRLVIYNNLAAAQLMINAYDSALLSVDHVIKLEPENVKALFRKAKILMAKGNTDEAVEVLTKVSSLEPDNNAVKKELSGALNRLAKEKIQAKSLYKKMMGTEKRSEGRGQPSPQPPGSSRWTKILGAAAVATVAVAFAYNLKYRTLNFWE